MSTKPKNNTKDKKKGNQSELQKIIDEQKREILQQTFTIKKLQDRLSRLTQQNYQIVSTKDKFHADYEQKIDKNRILVETHESTIKEKNNKIFELELERIDLKNKINNLERDLKQSEALKNREFQDYKKLTQNEINKLQNQLRQYNYYMAQRDKMENQNQKLKKNLQQEKETKTREIADKEREKVQTTDKLRDQMLTKVCDMRTNLLSLKKQQLSTTTRLAVLQNHQLTSQLEFQSKQSQKLIFQNQSLTKKVVNLQKDLQIHKQIQQELAKRSHYSRRIITKLTAKIGQLEQKIQDLKKSCKISKDEAQDSLKQKNAQIRYTIQEADNRQQMIKTLEKPIELTEKKHLQVELELEALKNQHSSIKVKLEKYEKNAEDLTNFLMRYYEDCLNNQIQVKDPLTDFIYDLKSMRKRKIEDWKNQEIRLLVTTLLNKLSSKINRKLLNLPLLNRNSVVAEDEDEFVNKTKFPAISDHTAISKLGSVHLNSSTSNLENKKLKDLPINMASKIVRSNLREWGRTVHANSVTHLTRKYKLAEK